jgi:hypothetical protein
VVLKCLLKALVNICAVFPFLARSICAATIIWQYNFSMDIHEGKQKFIEAWGRLAGSWSIPPAMAQMHALLLIAPEPLTAEQVKEQLDISSGNVSMNLRALMDWGLVYRESRNAERKDVYVAEKDMWTVVRQIIMQPFRTFLPRYPRHSNLFTQSQPNTRYPGENRTQLDYQYFFEHGTLTSAGNCVTLDNTLKIRGVVEIQPLPTGYAIFYQTPHQNHARILSPLFVALAAL